MSHTAVEGRTQEQLATIARALVEESRRMKDEGVLDGWGWEGASGYLLSETVAKQLGEDSRFSLNVWYWLDGEGGELEPISDYRKWAWDMMEE